MPTETFTATATISLSEYQRLKKSEDILKNIMDDKEKTICVDYYNFRVIGRDEVIESLSKQLGAANAKITNAIRVMRDNKVREDIEKLLW